MSSKLSAKMQCRTDNCQPVRYGTPEYRQVIEDIGRSAAESKLEGVNPHAAIDIVRQSRLGALRVPQAQGGGGCSIRELFAALIDLAEADPDIPHILRAHFWFVEELMRLTNSADRDRWLERIVAGDIFGNAVTEIGGSAAVGAFVLQTQLTPKGDGYVLNGTKYYCTGSLYSDWVRVIASNPEGELASAVIPTDRDGVDMKDDWDGIGQRLTGSGTINFDDAIVSADELLQATLMTEVDGESPQIPTEPYLLGQLCQLILTAIIVGVLRSILNDAVQLVRKRERTYSHGSAETAAADPLLLDVIGRIASSAIAAEAVVMAAADAQDEALATLVNGVTDFDLTHRGSLLAAQAKVMIDEIAPRAATMLFDVGGSSAIKHSADLDRHWRNIRTLSSHNPTPYKSRAIADYIVNGEYLPQNSFF